MTITCGCLRSCRSPALKTATIFCRALAGVLEDGCGFQRAAVKSGWGNNRGFAFIHLKNELFTAMFVDRFQVTVVGDDLRSVWYQGHIWAQGAHPRRSRCELRSAYFQNLQPRLLISLTATCRRSTEMSGDIRSGSVGGLLCSSPEATDGQTSRALCHDACCVSIILQQEVHPSLDRRPLTEKFLLAAVPNEIESS